MARLPTRPSHRPTAPATPAAPTPRFAPERQQRIAQALRDQGRVEVAQLAGEFGVSEDTVRRDLRQLAARGLVHKTHGGAVALQPGLMPSRERATLLTAAKQAIARAAVTQVQAHQSLFIDGGSTTLALAQALAGDAAPRPLTVVTASLDIACALAAVPQLRLVLAGGEFDAHTRSFRGEQALATLRGHRADIAFLGACALHERVGLTAHDAGEAALKRAMLDGAAQRVVLTDASKLDQIAACAVAPVEECDLVICDVAPAWLAARTTVQQVGRS